MWYIIKEISLLLLDALISIFIEVFERIKSLFKK